MGRRTRADVASEFREEYERWEKDPYTFAPVGGESGLQVTARALPALIKLVETHDGMPFVVVSHKATIRLLLSSLLGFDPRKYRDRLDQSPAALNILDFKDVTNARLTLFNDVSHYESEVPDVPSGRLSPVWSECGSWVLASCAAFSFNTSTRHSIALRTTHSLNV